MAGSDISEGMVKLAHALVETGQLRAWFYALETLPESLRKIALSEMAAQMRAAGEDSDLTEAIAALSRREIYDAMLAAVRERVGENKK
jgi:hypothetical protein